MIKNKKLLTDEQIRIIDDMNIEDRVALIREIFWNNPLLDENYKTVGLEDVSVSAENMEWYLKGATAMFDHAQMTAANHWHGHEHINEQCNKENDFLLSTMESAFEYINPDKAAVWKKLGEELGMEFKMKKKSDMNSVDFFKFMKDFPYWKTFKQQMYFIVNPVAHTRELIKTFKELKEEQSGQKNKKDL